MLHSTCCFNGVWPVLLTFAKNMNDILDIGSSKWDMRDQNGDCNPMYDELNRTNFMLPSVPKVDFTYLATHSPNASFSQQSFVGPIFLPKREQIIIKTLNL